MDFTFLAFLSTKPHNHASFPPCPSGSFLLSSWASCSRALFCCPIEVFSWLITLWYHYVNMSMNWNEAQRYCREKYTDLVTIESADDLTRLNRPSLGTYWSWIGLTDDPKSWKGVMGNDSNSWRWSATGKTSETDYHSWANYEPNYAYAQENCVFMNNGKWLDVRCWAKKRIVCFNGKKITIMFLVISAV
uniref:C-type lectin domain-containing protein n=1 Tax=Seriola lalandi dorsalis TaxID=1841481 RepID=A0A3B4WUS8_SERLL